MPCSLTSNWTPKRTAWRPSPSDDPADKEAFSAHWTRILGNESITIKTVLFGGRIAGNVLTFEQFGQREVSYWIGKAYWGQGVATAVLARFLRLVEIRPLYARAARDNFGSIRVLEKCGFTVCGEDSGFSNARDEEVEELAFELGGGEGD